MVRRYFPLLVSLIFLVGLFVPLGLALALSILSLILSFVRRGFLILIFILPASLRMFVENYQYLKLDEGTYKLQATSPTKDLLSLHGIGIVRYENVYPGRYEAYVEVSGDSLRILELRKVESRNALWKALDNFFRERVLDVHDYFMVRALLLGDRSYIPYELKEAFRETGNLHLLAISGLHVGIVFLIITFVLSLFYIPRKLLILVATLMILLYAYVLNFIPSVKRASIFISVFALSMLLERRIDYLNVWGVSLLLTLLISPLEVFNVGFQLSYSATFGILYMFRYRNTILDNMIINPLKVSISAQAFTLPFLLKHFGYAPVLYVFSTLITVPLTFIVVLNIFVCLLFPFVEQFWASLHVCINIFVYVVEILAKLNLPALKFELNWFEALVFLSILVLITWLGRYLSTNLLKLSGIRRPS